MKRLTTIVMGLLLAGSAVADSGGNSVYIDQTNADQSTVTITQSGANNNVGDSNLTTGNPFTIDGNSMNLTITQDGMNNSILGNFIGGNSNATISQIGNSNSTTLNMGNFGTSSGNLGITFNGSNNNSLLNIGTLHDSGNYNYNLTVTGDSNAITSTINSKNTNNALTVTGNSNMLTTVQTGANGTNGNGNNLTTSIIGSNNTVDVTQNGTTNPNSAIVNLTGSGASVSITQH
jgi:hypothetical protein